MSPTTPTRPPTPPLRWLLAPLLWLERARGRRRLALALLYLAILAVAGLFAWWALSLRGLPDVGDPFDVAAFGTVRLPDDQNAFVLYRQAVAQLKRANIRMSSGRNTPSDDWATADDAMRRWVLDNREALATWLRATRRPDALLVQPGQMTIATNLDVVQALRDFARLALLEGSRRAQAGDPSAAAELYAALLRSSRHAGMHGAVIQRLIGAAILRLAVHRVTAWAEDPRVNAEALRRVLADAIAAEAMTPPTSEIFKVEYLALRNELDRPGPVSAGALREFQAGSALGEFQDWTAYLPGGMPLRLFLLREPERSRRVVRLLFANWLAYVDRPPAQRQPAAIAAPGARPALNPFPFPFYQGDPDAPASSRALSPQELGRWFGTTIYARLLLPALESARSAAGGDRGQLRTLQVILAEQLYRRDHGGAAPKSLGALVGRYVPALPEGYTAADPPLTTTPAPSPSR
jgi:hypothetical protein